MHDLLKWFCIPALLLLFLITSCEEESSPAIGLEDLELRFLSVSIWANLGPVVSPDPILCHVDMEIQNTNSDQALTGLYIPDAAVYIDSSGELLGEILLTTYWDATDWDGHLEPGELDTVRLMKVEMEERPFDPPCDVAVYLELWVKDQSDRSQAFTSESHQFICAY